MSAEAQQWETPRPRPPLVPLLLLVAAALFGGAVLGRGGVAPPPAGLVVEEAPPLPDAGEVEQAPPAPDAWDESSPGPLAERSGATVVRIADDQVLIWGGVGERPYRDGAIYDPATQTWTLVAPSRLPPRSNAAGVWTGSEAVVLGGLAFDGRTNNPVPVGRARDGAAYDPVTNRWRPLPPLPFPIADMAAFTHRGRLYAVSATARSRPVAVLDRGSSMWRLAAELPEQSLRPGRIGARQVGDDIVLYPGARGRPIALNLPGEQWVRVGTFDNL